MGAADIGHPEIEDRFAVACPLHLGEEQADAAAIEESEIAEGIEMGEAERLAVELARRLGIGRSTLYRKLKEYGLEGDVPEEAEESAVLKVG